MRRDDLRALIEAPTPPCVTVFVTLEGAGVPGGADRQRLAVLLDDAEGALHAWGAGPRDAAGIVEPGRGWLDEAPWPSAWRGLAVYLSDGMAHHFGLRSPIGDRVVVAERFLVGPLIGELERQGGFWVLALSRNQPQLLRGDADGLRPTQVRLPTFDQVVAVDEAEPSLQYHRAGGGAARAAVAYHGHGGLKDADDEQVVRWLAAVAERVDAALQGQLEPLVLAGVAEQTAAYRRTCRYRNALPTGLAGNADRRSEADLHAAVWPLVEQQLDRVRQCDLDRYAERAGTGWTATDLDEVTGAAEQGRVEVLFATIDPPPDEEIGVDAAIVAVWTAGGTVHVLEGPAPGGGPVAAILRYVAAPAAGSGPRPVEA